jgi:SAM-dependent methyltransferase
MQQRHQDRQLYFNELASTCEKYFLPFIRRKRPINQQSNVLEIGCGEGGNLVPFARLGCQVTGIDLSPLRIEQAKSFFASNQLQGTFMAADFFDLTDLPAAFDIIILHDVIEHVDDKIRFFSKVKQLCHPQGIVFVGFPAWQMPFGGHQQIGSSKLASHLPFIHLLPKSLYAFLLKACGEKEDAIRELLSIRETKCTIEYFYQVVRKAGFTVKAEQLYFINPHYESKFGLKPRKLTPLIGKIPYLRNFFSTSCLFLIQPVD